MKQSDTTVGQLKSMVDETTDGILKPHAMVMTHKSKSMDDSGALLTIRISDGSEVVLILNHEETLSLLRLRWWLNFLANR